MTDYSLAKLATVSASTKRAPAISSGKRGAAATNLTGLLITPLDPIDPEIRQRLGLNTPHEVYITFVDTAVDIMEGDLLVVGSTEYPVRSVADWSAGSYMSAYKQIIVEELKTT